MAVRLNPYLVFEGNAREAVEFYRRALDAELVNLSTFGDMPGNPDHPTPPEVKERVMHALMKVGETELMISDTFPGSPYTVGNNVCVTVIADSAELTKKFFEALQDGGQVVMPVQETFWSPAYGMVRDKFGVTFQLSTEQPQQT